MTYFKGVLKCGFQNLMNYVLHEFVKTKYKKEHMID